MQNYILSLGLLILLAACKDAHHEEDAHDHDHKAMTTSMPEDDHIELTQTQISNIGLKYGKITPRKIRSTVKLTGRIELPPSGKSVVGSPLEGKIQSVYVKAGEYVRAGQRLFALQNLEIIDWQQQWSEAHAELVYLRGNLARQKQLSEQDLAPKKSYELALAKKQQMEAKVKAVESKLMAIGIEVKDEGSYQSSFYALAPSAGTIQHLMVSKGEFITTATPLADIINNKNLHLHLLAYGEQVRSLEKDQELNFYVQSRPDQIKQAEIFWINEMVNEENNSYDVHAEIRGDISSLSPGEFVEARVIDHEMEVNTLPSGAVTYDKGLHYIFAVTGAETDAIHFQQIQIALGVSDLGYVEVLPIDDLPESADVVIDGAFFIMAQSKKGEEGAGHSH